jgi:hypothetical protein
MRRKDEREEMKTKMRTKGRYIKGYNNGHDRHCIECKEKRRKKVFMSNTETQTTRLLTGRNKTPKEKEKRLVRGQ